MTKANFRLYPGEPNPYDVKLRHGIRHYIHLFIEVISAKDTKTRQKALHRLFIEVVGARDRAFIYRWYKRHFLEHPHQKISKE